MTNEKILFSLVGIIFLSGCVGQPQQTTTTTIPITTTLTTTTATQTIQTTTTTPPQPKTYSVELINFAFNPSEIRIKLGDTVVWTNRDSTVHTVTSDSGTELNSPSLSQSTTYSHTFNQPGTFAYHCSLHPSMKGKVIVEV